MFLGHGVRSLVGVGRDAFRACDVHEGVIARLVRLLGHGPDGAQLLFRIDETLVPPGNIVVHFDAKDVALLGVADNLLRIVGLQAVRPDAHVVGPILAGRELLGEAERGKQDEKRERQHNANAGS